MGKAVDLMMSGGKASAKNIENSTVTTGNGGIPKSLQVKAAGTKPASVTNINPVTGSKTPSGEKINNLF